MDDKKYYANWSLIVTFSVAFTGIFLLGFLERGLDHDFLEGVVIILLVLGFLIWTKLNTFLQLKNKRTVVNSGYRSFRKDICDVYDVKYVFRVPQFTWKHFGGSLMILYVKGDDGKLRHSIVREVNYKDQTLKEFLKRITTLNPSIELDKQYRDFLEGKLGGENQPRFVRTPANRTPAQVEELLREKGEKF